MPPQWLTWAQRLQALAQNGLTYAKDPYDVERYAQIREIASEIIGTQTKTEPALLDKLFAEEIGYATPKIDVRGVVFQDDAILLVREKEDGGWTLPGGWVDVGESPREAVVKEVYEESGFLTKPIKLLAIWDRNKHSHPPFIHHIYKIFIRCEIIGGSPASSIETEAASFYRKDSIPQLSLTRVVPQQIARLFEHYDHPDWPADFD